MQYSEMQVGDKVEITDKRTVTISRVDVRENAYDQDGKIIVSTGPYGDREFGLIARSIPPLPTKFGSIISVQGDNLFNEPDEFILVNGMYVGSVWRSIDKGGAKSVSEMAKFVTAHGGFEVIR